MNTGKNDRSDWHRLTRQSDRSFLPIRGLGGSVSFFIACEEGTGWWCGESIE
ncbi:hypothetical protein [Selenomonas ruminantium]|uniref:hypothetical protein n=1 Tax=Selenomonas ruminantium TaxID=971 RepID=UPI0015A5A31F|nr:hypothetical protein [Selenomonas ruminantium]